MTVAFDNLIPSYIQAARVLDVDPSAWTMTVRTEMGDQIIPDVPLVSPYTHVFDGEGIHFMPEPGSSIWLCRPSEGDARPFAITYRPLNDEIGGHRANRPNLNPGDIALITRDRNGIKLRRGGVVEVFSTPIARMFFLPTKNTILTFAQNWFLETFGGFLKWVTDRPEEDPDGLAATRMDLSVKEFAEHPEAAARLQVGGKISEDGEQVVDLRVWQDSTVNTRDEPLRESVSMTADRSGNVDFRTYQPAPGDPEEDISDSVKVTLNADGELKVQLKDGGQFAVFNTEVNTEGVLLGRTFITGLQGSLTELMGIINTAGFPTPTTLQFLTDVATTLAADPKGGAPFISTRTRTE